MELRVGTMTSKVGVKDVAAAAGVSVGTVSNVLNHPERVSAWRRARVLAEVARLGYVPDEAARQLRLGDRHHDGEPTTAPDDLSHIQHREN